MNERRKVKGLWVGTGDIVSIVTIYPHPEILGAAYFSNNGAMQLLTASVLRFNSEGVYFNEERHEFGLQEECIREIRFKQKADDAIPRMSGGRAYKKNELVYLQDGKIKCHVGNVIAAFKNIVVVETNDGYLKGNERLWRRVKNEVANLSSFKIGTSVYKILNNGDYIWGKIIGFGQIGRTVIVEQENKKCFIAPVQEWNLF